MLMSVNSSTFRLDRNSILYVYNRPCSGGGGHTFSLGFKPQGDPDGENNFTDGNGRGGFRFEPLKVYHVVPQT